MARLPGKDQMTMDVATGLICPMCGAAGLIDRQCRRLCENCGYVESCEDLFVSPPSESAWAIPPDSQEAKPDS